MDDRHDTFGAHGTVVHPACLQRLDGSHRPGGQEPVTRPEIEAILAAMDAMDERWDQRIAALERRWDERWSERQEAMDQRWGERLGAMDIRLVEMDKRWQVEGREPGAAGVCCPASDDRTASGCRHQAPNTSRMMSPWNSGRSSVTGAK